MKISSLPYLEINDQVYFQLDELSSIFGLEQDSSDIPSEELLKLTIPKKKEKKEVLFITISGFTALIDQNLSENVGTENQQSIEEDQSPINQLSPDEKTITVECFEDRDELYAKMRNFLERKIHENWDQKSYKERLEFFTGNEQGTVERESFTLDEMVIEGLQAFHLYKNAEFYETVRNLMKRDPMWIWQPKVTGLYLNGEGYIRRHLHGV